MNNNLLKIVFKYDYGVGQVKVGDWEKLLEIEKLVFYENRGKCINGEKSNGKCEY